MPRTSLLRDIHQASVLNMLRRYGSTSRARLAQQLGLTRSTLTNLVGDLIEAGYVTESGQRVVWRQTGRPGVGLVLNAAGAYFLGADLGFGSLHIVLLDLAASVVDEEHADFNVDDEPQQVLGALSSLIRPMVRRMGVAASRLKGIGVTVPGTCDGGRILLSPSLGWRDIDVRTAIGSATGRTVLVENDAKAAALAEIYFAQEPEPEDLVYLLLSSGVGGGIVIDGEIFRGAFGAAGEVGNMRLARQGPTDSKGNVGTLEAFCGSQALLSAYHQRGGSASGLPGLMDDLALSGSAATDATMEWGSWLAAGVLTLVNVLNPHRIVLGGPLAALFPYVERTLLARVREERLPGSHSVAISRSALGDESSALGAAVLVYHSMFSLPMLSGAGRESTLRTAQGDAAAT